MKLHTPRVATRRARIKRWLRSRQVPVSADATTKELIALVALAKRAEKGKAER